VFREGDLTSSTVTRTLLTCSSNCSFISWSSCSFIAPESRSGKIATPSRSQRAAGSLIARILVYLSDLGLTFLANSGLAVDLISLSQKMKKWPGSVMIVTVLLLIRLDHCVGNECCNTIPWGDNDWCHAFNCRGIGCQFDNPDTSVDESKTKCEEISKCFCAKVSTVHTHVFARKYTHANTHSHKLIESRHAQEHTQIFSQSLYRKILAQNATS